MLQFIFVSWHEEFVVEKMALGKGFLRILGFFRSVSFQRFSIHIRLSESGVTQSEKLRASLNNTHKNVIQNNSNFRRGDHQSTLAVRCDTVCLSASQTHISGSFLLPLWCVQFASTVQPPVFISPRWAIKPPTRAHNNSLRPIRLLAALSSVEGGKAETTSSLWPIHPNRNCCVRAPTPI